MIIDLHPKADLSVASLQAAIELHVRRHHEIAHLLEYRLEVPVSALVQATFVLQEFRCHDSRRVSLSCSALGTEHSWALWCFDSAIYSPGV